MSFFLLIFLQKYCLYRYNISYQLKKNVQDMVEDGIIITLPIDSTKTT